MTDRHPKKRRDGEYGNAMKQLIGSLTAAIWIVAVSGAAGANSYKVEAFTCNQVANNLEYGCKISGGNNNNAAFSFNLVNPSSYIVERTWARARLADESSWTEIADQKGNIASGAGLSFRFDEEWIAGKLNTNVDTLRAKGYQFRFKIKSVGGGAGREDTCDIAEVAYNASSGIWSWRKKENTGSSWDPAGEGHAFVYKAGGSVNAVKCRFELTS
jgi:hypothetical protein